MTVVLEVLMLLSSLLLVVGGLRVQPPSKYRVHGAMLVAVVGIPVVFAIVFYTGQVRDLRVALIVGAAMLFAVVLYARAYRLASRG